MFKSFLDGLGSSNTSGGAQNGSKGATPAQLRADIYTGMDQICSWIASGKPENGIDYRSILSIVEKHFPGTEINRCTDEVAVLVGGLMNMTFEYSKTDGLPGAMALRTLTERMVVAWKKVESEESRQSIGRGIVRGINEFADPALVTREFAPRVQIMGSLRELTAAIYGKGSAEARNADVVLGSKFI